MVIVKCKYYTFIKINVNIIYLSTYLYYIGTIKYNFLDVSCVHCTKSCTL